jgi:uncharacterized membrane protein YgcG
MSFFLWSRRVRCWGLSLSLVCLTFCAARAVAADDRALFWRELSVHARLDAEGRLHVSELHRMVFTGEWNGGERVFRYEGTQQLRFQAISRVLSDGSEKQLSRGDLTRKDGYDWADDHTLRWRNRLPIEPPFDETELAYRIQYQLSGILLTTGAGEANIDHQFAFTGRPGIIESFRLHLELDPVWRTTEAMPIDLQRGPLQPDEGVRVTLPLTRSTSDSVAPSTPESTVAKGGSAASVTPSPAAVSTHPSIDAKPEAPLTTDGTFSSGVPLLGRICIAAGFLGTITLLLWRVIRWQRRVGHFAPLLPPSMINDSWLAEHVLSLKPEVIGAAYDRKTGAAEVAALLARLEAEGKIRSSVGASPGKRKTSLELELLVEREQLVGYERQLIDKLFFFGNRTSTQRLEQHYRGSGFDPASVLRAPLDNAIDVMLQRRRDESRGWSSCLLPLVMLLATIALEVSLFRMVHSSVSSSAAHRVSHTLIFGGMLFLLVGVPLASRFREDMCQPLSAARWFVAWVVLAAAWLATLVVLTSGVSLSALVVACVSGCTLAFQVIWVAWSREEPSGLALRKRLAAARLYFQQQLRQKAPRLDDAWFPYLIAMDLGGDVDRWWHSFGTRSAPPVPSRGERLGNDQAFDRGGNQESSAPWTGGGGRFGGAGASGSWSSAAAQLGAGVIAPISSSSRQGSRSSGSSFTSSSGGGRSGGGGGGGW